MRKLALPLSLAAAAGLAACATPETETRTTAARGGPPFVASVPKESAIDYRTGFGVVEAVSRAPSLSAAAGGTAVRSAGGGSVGSSSGTPVTSSGDQLYRLAIRMEDGRIQYVDTDENYTVGQRVELLPDRLIRRH